MINFLNNARIIERKNAMGVKKKRSKYENVWIIEAQIMGSDLWEFLKEFSRRQINRSN